MLSSIPSGKKNFGWLVALLLGIVTPYGVYSVYRIVNQPIDPKIVTAAKDVNVEPNLLVDLKHISNEIRKTEKVTEAQWNRIRELYQRPEPGLRSFVLQVLMFFPTTAYTNEVIQMARENIDHSNSMAQLYSLFLLWKNRVPDLLEIAKKKKNSDYGELRKLAEDIIKKSSNQETTNVKESKDSDTKR